jgi:glycosyltransferase involved in cell wall biosynthesis
MINISFAITVCDEAFELDRLLNQLDKCVIEGDEVVIQVDESNTTSEVLNVISSYEGKYNPVISRSKEKIVSSTKVFHSLNNDFAEFKNNLFKNCTKEYIFQIDADEEVTQDQIHLIREILELNSDVDCFLVPRINTVKGLTKEHVGKWGWRVDEEERINYPDFQTRICKNKPEIQWVNKVHEKLIGYKQMALLPSESILALQHHKTIQKQEKQNNFYDKL